MTDAITAAYRAGATTRQIAAEHGIHESTVRRRLRQAGVDRRAPGVRPMTDLDRKVVRLRQQRLRWSEIAGRLGVSRTAVQHAYFRATGETGADLTPQRWRPLAASERRRLVALHDAIPASSSGAGRATRQSAQGDALAERVRHLITDGVSRGEIARTLGHSAAWVGYLLGEHAAAPR